MKTITEIETYLCKPPVDTTTVYARSFSSAKGLATVYGDECASAVTHVDGWYCYECHPVVVTYVPKPPLVSNDHTYVWGYYEQVDVSISIDATVSVQVPIVITIPTTVPAASTTDNVAPIYRSTLLSSDQPSYVATGTIAPIFQSSSSAPSSVFLDSSSKSSNTASVMPLTQISSDDGLSSVLTSSVFHYSNSSFFTSSISASVSSSAVSILEPSSSPEPSSSVESGLSIEPSYHNESSRYSESSSSIDITSSIEISFSVESTSSTDPSSSAEPIFFFEPSSTIEPSSLLDISSSIGVSSSVDSGSSIELSSSLETSSSPQFNSSSTAFASSSTVSASHVSSFFAALSSSVYSPSSSQLYSPVPETTCSSLAYTESTGFVAFYTAANSEWEDAYFANGEYRELVGTQANLTVDVNSLKYSGEISVGGTRICETLVYIKSDMESQVVTLNNVIYGNPLIFWGTYRMDSYLYLGGSAMSCKNMGEIGEGGTPTKTHINHLVDLTQTSGSAALAINLEADVWYPLRHVSVERLTNSFAFTFSSETFLTFDTNVIVRGSSDITPFLFSSSEVKKITEIETYLCEPPVDTTTVYARSFSSAKGLATVYGDECASAVTHVDGWYCYECHPVVVTYVPKPPLVSNDHTYVWGYYEQIDVSISIDATVSVQVPIVVTIPTTVPAASTTDNVLTSSVSNYSNSSFSTSSISTSSSTVSILESYSSPEPSSSVESSSSIELGSSTGPSSSVLSNSSLIAVSSSSAVGASNISSSFTTSSSSVYSPSSSLFSSHVSGPTCNSLSYTESIAYLATYSAIYWEWDCTYFANGEYRELQRSSETVNVQANWLHYISQFTFFNAVIYETLVYVKYAAKSPIIKLTSITLAELKGSGSLYVGSYLYLGGSAMSCKDMSEIGEGGTNWTARYSHLLDSIYVESQWTDSFDTDLDVDVWYPLRHVLAEHLTDHIIIEIWSDTSLTFSTDISVQGSGEVEPVPKNV
ncbi:hypothetical protein CANCADRAFT_1336 [Tortispora caseinolytica NRRL Y-17796]|uniref:Uncharacterized protein n=1 Tax=Tortispora caseinolytica NRRL Y-17796 TaxID=767744 RepID=A0A1E4TLW5_9ASCO|nr:hypothetical protein CANCADRAFT_1336 [Tortispora caseinolytica NRRL Y-17796]